MVGKHFGITTVATALAMSYHLPLHVSSAAVIGISPGSDAIDSESHHRRRLCGEHGWHASQPVDDGCSDDANYNEAWTRPGLIGNFFHDTVEECCNFFFGNKPCKKYPPTCGGVPESGGVSETAKPTAKPTVAQVTTKPPTKPPTRPPTRPPTKPPTLQASDMAAPTGGGTTNGGDAFGGKCMWHPDLVEKDGCTDNNNYPPEWLNPGVKERMFHLTAEACCEKVYKSSACKQYPKGCNDAGYVGGGTTLIPPSSTPRPPPTRPGVPTRRPVTVLVLWLKQTSGTCINVEDEKPPSWVKDTFPNYGSCCERSWDQNKCMAAVPQAEPEEAGPSFYPVEDIGVCVDERKFPKPTSIDTTFDTYSKCCLLGTTDSDKCLSSYREFYYDVDTDTCVKIEDPDNAPLAVAVTYLEYSACCIKAALGVTDCLDSNPDVTVKTETADVDPTEPRPDPVWYLPYAGTVCVDEYDVPKPYYIKTTYDNYVNCCAKEIEDVEDAKYCIDKEPTKEPSMVPTFSPSTPWPTLSVTCPEEYDPSATYIGGSEVHVNEVMYQCRPYPYTPYCNNVAFRPGIEGSTVWEEAWTKLFVCVSEPSSRPSEAPSVYPSSQPTCEKARWHPGDLNRRICTNSPDYPVLWDSPPLSQTYFTDSADECCEKFYESKRCRIRDVCD